MDQKFLHALNEKVVNNGNIDPDLFIYHNVKRGLRNQDGTGVLVGLTEVGDVHGYILDEGEKVPDAGRLRYRGINVNDIVKAFSRREDRVLKKQFTCF